MAEDEVVKFDDADWHSGDAANEVQAGMHIALVYHWLLSRGHINKEYIPDEWQERINDQTISPSEFFLEWADGKLLSFCMDDAAAEFLGSFYHKRYLPDVQRRKIPNLQYDIRYESPYDIRDVWGNVEATALYLDKSFKKWRRPKPKFLKNVNLHK